MFFFKHVKLFFFLFFLFTFFFFPVCFNTNLHFFLFFSTHYFQTTNLQQQFNTWIFFFKLRVQVNMNSTFNLNTLNIIIQSNQKIEQFFFQMFVIDNAHNENSHTHFFFNFANIWISNAFSMTFIIRTIRHYIIMSRLRNINFLNVFNWNVEARDFDNYYITNDFSDNRYFTNIFNSDKTLKTFSNSRYFTNIFNNDKKSLQVFLSSRHYIDKFNNDETLKIFSNSRYFTNIFNNDEKPLQVFSNSRHHIDRFSSDKTLKVFSNNRYFTNIFNSDEALKVFSNNRHHIDKFSSNETLKIFRNSRYFMFSSDKKTLKVFYQQHYFLSLYSVTKATRKIWIKKTWACCRLTKNLNTLKIIRIKKIHCRITIKIFSLYVNRFFDLRINCFQFSDDYDIFANFQFLQLRDYFQNLKNDNNDELNTFIITFISILRVYDFFWTIVFFISLFEKIKQQKK